MLQFFVAGQRLDMGSTAAVIDAANQITAQFTFQSQEWEGMNQITALFSDGADTYGIKLTDGKIQASDKLWLPEGRWTVHLLGETMDGDTVTAQISTSCVSFTVRACCGGENSDEVSTPPTWSGGSGAPGKDGKDGITPTIGSNGNWYLGTTDTGQPSRGEQGPAGKDGAGLDVTGASVGQIVKIAAVDADGTPTAWTAINMPTGGGGENWELITSGEMAEAAALTVTKDADGAALALKSAQIIVEGATSMAKTTMLRFEVDNRTDARNSEEWAVELAGDNKTDNADIRAVYVARQNEVPILYAELPISSTANWGTNAFKAQGSKKNTKVDGVPTYSFEPLTATINRIYVGNYMGNGMLGAGCKYQIWGVRA